MKCPKCQSDNLPETKFCPECGTRITPTPAASASALPTETLQSPSQELTRGTTFAGRFEVIEELGKGGMGKVYRVVDKKIDEEIALKVLKPEIAADRGTLERFRNELKLARRISHRHVCRMFDLSEEAGTSFITMELVSGEDLKSFIRRVGQLPVGKAISIASQVAEGLAEAHRLNVVHRDLKPQNIMIDRDGNARIMDFGVARSLKSQGITGAGIMIGTPEYMSPEQVEGQEADPRADIYALGVILFEMLTGRVPFAGDTPLSIAMKQKSEVPPDPIALNPQISEELGRLILRCLEKDREKRYARVEEVLSELKKIETGVTPASGLYRPSTSVRVGKRKRTPALVILPAAVIAVAAIALLIIKTSGAKLDPNLVVVGLFENKTGNQGLDNLGRMAAEQITQGLNETGIIPTVSTPTVETSIKSFKGGDPIRFLAGKTGAGIVVSGAYYLQGDEIRLQSQVNDVKSKELLYALEPVTGPLNEPSKAIEILRQRLMGYLAAMFNPRTKTFSEAFSPPPSYEAYQDYAEGMELFMRREFQGAIEHLTRAASHDPSFVGPLEMAAVSYWNMGQNEKADSLAQEVAKSKEKLLRGERIFLDALQAWLSGDKPAALQCIRALNQIVSEAAWKFQLGLEAIRNNYPREAVRACESFNPENEAMKGWYYYWGNFTWAYHILGDHKRELETARRGRKQYPELLATLAYEVQALAAMGRIEELNERLDESLNMPPERGWSPAGVMRIAADELRAHGFKEESLKAAERSIAWYKAHPDKDYRGGLADSLYSAERWDEARAIYEELSKESPDNEGLLGYIGTLAARRGDREEAMRISEELKGISRPYLFGNNTYWRACIASLLGEKEEAMNLLREALAQGQDYTRLHPDMDLEPLWDYPPFKELIKPKG
jgi:serine/threonine protein kinase/Flp pilus assembly protein TadD